MTCRRLTGLCGVVIWLGAIGCAGHRATPPAIPTAQAPVATSPAAPDAARAQPRDSDGDGIADDVDACPDAPETRNGCNDDDGCPDQFLAIRLPSQPKILDKIFFAPGSAKIDPRFLALMDVLASAIASSPDLGEIEVQGHAARNERHALKLTKARAANIEAYLCTGSA